MYCLASVNACSAKAFTCSVNDEVRAKDALPCAKGKAGFGLNGKCMHCPKGQYQSFARQSICFPCISGTFQSKTGQTECEACGVNSYSDASGATACKVCPEDKRPNAEHSACLKPDWTTARDCSMFEALDNRNSDPHLHKCIPCPEGAHCNMDGDNSKRPTLSELQPMDGFLAYSWAPSDQPFAPCPRGTSSCQNGSCIQGYDPEESVAPLCSVCISGYTLQSNRCVRCDLSYFSEKIAVGSTTLAIFMLMIVFLRKQISRAIKKYWKVLVHVISILKIQINFVQIGCSTGIVIPVKWPEIYLRWLDYLNFFQFDIVDILGLNCISELNSYEASFLATTTTLILCNLIIFGTYLWVSNTKHKSLVAAKPKRARAMQNRVDVRNGNADGDSTLAKADVAHAAGILFDTMDVDLGGTICPVELGAVIRYMQKHHNPRTDRVSISHRWGNRRKSKEKRSTRPGALKTRRTSVNAKSTVFSRTFVVTTQFMIMLGATENAKTKELHLDKTRFIKAMVDGKLSGDPPMLEWVYHIEQERVQHTYMSTIVQLLLLFYAPISQKLFFYFNSLEIGHRSFMIADYSMEVGSDRYARFVPVVLLVGVIFTLGLPFFILYVLVFKHRHELQTPTVLNRYGFLYSRYAPGSQLWEVHEIFRKLFLCGIIVILPGRYRAASATMVCVLTCCSLNFSSLNERV